MKRLLYIVGFLQVTIWAPLVTLGAQDTLQVDIDRLTFGGYNRLSFGGYDNLSFSTTSITAGVDESYNECDTAIIDSRVQQKITFWDWPLSDSLYDWQIENYWDTDASLQGNGSATFTVPAGIILDNGKKVIVAEYWEGHCCYVNNPATEEIGTGFTIYDPFQEERVIALGFNMKLMPGFALTKSLKCPGFQARSSQNAEHFALFRMVLQHYPQSSADAYGGVAHDIRPAAYYSVADDPDVHLSGIDYEFPTDQWVHVDVAVESNYLGSNGKGYIYIDGIKMYERSFEWRKDGYDVPFWNVGKIETEMGGVDTSYNSPQYQWIRYADFIRWEIGSNIGDDTIISILPADANFGRK